MHEASCQQELSRCGHAVCNLDSFLLFGPFYGLCFGSLFPVWMLLTCASPRLQNLHKCGEEGVFRLLNHALHTGHTTFLTIPKVCPHSVLMRVRAQDDCVIKLRAQGTPHSSLFPRHCLALTFKRAAILDKHLRPGAVAYPATLHCIIMSHRT